MFDNIGGKIKGLAKVICWVGIICSVITGAIMFADEDAVLMGFLVIVLGSLSAWIGCFVLYGFGELIAISLHISDMLSRSTSVIKGVKDAEKTITYGSEQAPISPSTWKCSYCGQENKNISAQCKGCGKYRT